MTQPTHFDLFSGIGGFALAAKWSGFETVGFSEIDPFCIKVLQKNFPKVKNYGDIKEITIPLNVNLITGGFPCQPFSQAGSKRGVQDERYLWPEFKRILNKSHPDWVVIENVSGVIPVALDDIVDDLAAEGYKAEVFVIPACAANAPHRRDRVWIIAHLNGIGGNVRLSDWTNGYIQQNLQRYVAQVQSKWSQLKPDAWAINQAFDWLAYNTRISRGYDGISGWMDKDRIKAVGNSIVPQVIYPILQYIKDSYE